MVKLTEEMVAARTRISDLSMVKKLNCWGADLTDVSLIGTMPNVEVLALSVNQIKTLSHFQNCARLQELYVRKNNINDLREVCYLKHLPSLQNLWLADNPCAEVEGYRHTVLRTLPNLKKLDDIAITSEEIREASRLGRQLSLPGPEETIESPKSAIINDPPQPVIPPIKDRSPTKNAESKVPHHVPQPRRKSIVSPAPTPTSVSTPTPVHTPSTPVRSPTPTHTPPEEVIETNTQPAADEVTTNLSPNNESPKRRFSTMSSSHSFQEKPVVHSDSAPSSRRSSIAVSPYPALTEHVTSPYSMNNSSSMDQIGSRCPVHHATFPPNGGSQEQPVEHPSYSSIPAAPISAMQPPYMQHHADHPHATPNSELRNNYFSDHRGYRPMHDSHPTRAPSLRDCYGPSTYNSQYLGAGQNMERISPTRSSSGGRTRNRASNLLMATLCLVNELDFSSLEVLSVAVRNRLEEFDD